MNQEKELTLTEEQIKIERGSFQPGASLKTGMRTSYLTVNNEGSDGTDGADADGTDGTDTSDADGTDTSDADGTDGVDTRM